MTIRLKLRLLFGLENGLNTFLCAGVLINEWYVLTAAHCISSREVIGAGFKLKSVRLGDLDAVNDVSCSGGDDCSPIPLNIEVAEMVPHPAYLPDSRTQLNDIALLRLTTPVSFNEFVRPICLPLTEYMRNAGMEPRPMLVSDGRRASDGLYFESSQKLRSLAYLVPSAGQMSHHVSTEVNSTTNAHCNQLYEKQNFRVEWTQLCAGTGGGDLQNVCDIMGGGPLFTLDESDSDNPHFYLVGIVSSNPNSCTLKHMPDVYTRVSEYLKWITENIY